MNAERCKKCIYSAQIPGVGDRNEDGKAPYICDYIGHTGHARMLICKAGDECTVFEPKGGNRKRYREKLKRLFKANRAGKKKKDVRKPIIKYDLDGNEICRYDSISDAARELNTSTKNIRHSLQDESKTARGFKWRYAEAAE